MIDFRAQLIHMAESFPVNGLSRDVSKPASRSGVVVGRVIIDNHPRF